MTSLLLRSPVWMLSLIGLCLPESKDSALANQLINRQVLYLISPAITEPFIPKAGPDKRVFDSIFVQFR